MRKLILATASVFALGVAASGVGYARQPSNAAQPPQSNTMGQPSATTPSGNAAAMQPGEQGTAPVRVSRAQVRQIQQQLQKQGFYKGRIDGVMGPETRQAIARFQQQNGMQATGNLDQQTLAALTSNGTSGAGSTAAPNMQPPNTGAPNETGNPNQK